MRMELIWILQLSALALQLSVAAGEEGAIPLTAARSPPEGNTTFLDGTTWCVARGGVSEVDLKTALDWACGRGMVDCTAIQEGGPCFEPDTLVSHASYAFNNYYQTNGNNDIACHFGGTAVLTKNNPSYGRCLYAASGPLRLTSDAVSHLKPYLRMWKYYVGIWLLLYMRG